MSDQLHIELCPETGICSIIRADATKIDLMPDEVDAIRDAADDLERIKAILAESDRGFSDAVTAVDLHQIGRRLG